jgi:hypothetical protein
LPVSERGADECEEEWMRSQRLRLKLRMKLAAQEPRMLRRFDDLHILPIRRPAGDAKTGIGQRFFVLAIELVAVTVTLTDFGCFVCAERG